MSRRGKRARRSLAKWTPPQSPCIWLWWSWWLCWWWWWWRLWVWWLWRVQRSLANKTPQQNWCIWVAFLVFILNSPNTMQLKQFNTIHTIHACRPNSTNSHNSTIFMQLFKAYRPRSPETSLFHNGMLSQSIDIFRCVIENFGPKLFRPKRTRLTHLLSIASLFSACWSIW